MPHSYLLQDWTTVTAGAGGTVKQGEDRYLDLSGYQDVAIYLDVGTATSGTVVEIDTSPNKEDAYFRSIATFTSPSAGVTLPPTIVRWASATTPLARFVRWRLTATGPWSATFRLWLSCNQAGGR